MSESIKIDLFAEDRSHEHFLEAILKRLATEENIDVNVHPRSARGGHGKALEELELYQRSVQKGIAGLHLPDLLVVAIDANCSSANKARVAIQAKIYSAFQDRTVIACPDPHIERWYLADPEALKELLGVQPKIGRKKCKRDYYKEILSDTLRKAGYLSTLGGIEFAPEIVGRMDLYRAGKTEPSLKHFLTQARSKFKTFKQ